MRPFVLFLVDIRPCFFSDIAMDYPRRELINHVASKSNLVMNLSRIVKLDKWKHALVSDQPSTAIVMDINGSYAIPLYVYSDPKKKGLFNERDDGSVWTLSEKGRSPNLNPEFVREIEAKLGLEFLTEGAAFLPNEEISNDTAWFGPEDIFHYAYAIFHSPTYRERYAEFLKIDFPRLPLTSNVSLFQTLCEYGAELVQLHLMKHPSLATTATTFPAEGDDMVASKGGYPKYEQGKVYINKTQYFDNIPEGVWEFHMGGYQVLHKWLKDRRGRELNFEDMRHYQRIVVALSESIHIMEAIDEAIPAFPIN